jgi:hypothetical protein
MSTETKAAARCFTCGIGPVVACAECGVRFAFAPELHARKLENGEPFYCPNGHVLSYAGNSENDRLKRELAAAQARIEKARAQTERERQRTEHEKRSHAATKGQLTKTKKRVGSGVCPCCNRTFKQLAAHMETKHPDWKDAP